MPPSIVEAIRAIPVFSRLSTEELGHLAAVSRLVRYPKGRTLFEEGQDSGTYFTVVTGRVKVLKSLPSGKDVILHFLSEGDPVGTVATFEGRPFPASAVAIEPTVCLLVPRREFFALIERHPALVRGLLAGLTHRLMELTSRITELTGGQVEPRLARLFLKMADQIGRPQSDGLFIPMPLSRQELADLTGTRIETAIRIMSRWGKRAIVRTRKDGFVVVNRAALERFAAES
jgi:CRP-like cAMP-binding protein